MVRWIARVAALSLALAPLAASALVIDTFETEQEISGPEHVVGGNVPVGYSLSPVPGAISDSRFVGVGGTVRNAQAVTRVASGELRFTVQVAPDTSFGNVSWDLTTPVDLTEGGTADAFAFDLSEQTIDATLTLFVYSGGSSSTAGSSASLSLGGPGHYEVPFSVFASGTPGNPGLPPADFTAANRIGLNFTSTTDVTGDFVIAGPFQTVPEPELALLASAAALLLVASRLANAFPGVGRFGHERAHAPRPGRDRRDR